MFEKRYRAKTQFDLYEQLVASLQDAKFHEGFCRVFIFRETEPLVWEQTDFLETNNDKECGEFSVSRRVNGFYVLLDGKETPFQVTFYSTELTVLASFHQDRLLPFEFEDNRKNDALKKYDQGELKKSAAFLKKILG